MVLYQIVNNFKEIIADQFCTLFINLRKAKVKINILMRLIRNL